MYGQEISESREYIRHRSWKEGVLRSTFRRVPCNTFLITIMTILCVTIFGAYVILTHFRIRLAHFDQEEDIIRGLAQYASYDFCPYINDWQYFSHTMVTWNFMSCRDACGNMAYAFRTRMKNESSPLVSGSNSVCHSFHDVTPCSNLTFCTNITTFSYCPGVNGAPIDEAGRQIDGKVMEMSNRTVKIAPLYENEVLTAHMGQVMHANNLIVQCPICSIGSTTFAFRDTSSGTCFENIVTLTFGKGSRFQFCDEFAVARDCSSYVTLDIPTPVRYSVEIPSRK